MFPKLGKALFFINLFLILLFFCKRGEKKVVFTVILKESLEVLLSVFVSVRSACFSFPNLLASLLLRPGQTLLPLAGGACVI